jgi:hypothetical protein
MKDEAIDYMYPQVVGERLSYIQKTYLSDTRFSYQIITMPYPTIPVLTKSDIIEHLVVDQDHLVGHSDGENKCLIYDFGEQPIGHLKMVSKNKGFVLAYPVKFLNDKSIFECIYYGIKFDQNKWTRLAHASLAIPAKLLFDQDQCLYEGIKPFLFVAD